MTMLDAVNWEIIASISHPRHDEIPQVNYLSLDLGLSCEISELPSFGGVVIQAL